MNRTVQELGLTASAGGTQSAIAGTDACDFFSTHFSAASMNFWLMKSEPGECSIDDVSSAKNQTVPWTGVRNYQARNFMRDSMRVGDLAFFYHSSCPEPGIAGIVEIATPAYPDPTQFDAKSKYHDPKSTRESPRWMLVDTRLSQKTRLIPLSELREHEQLAEMRILARGNRLSITPVTPAEWKFITKKLLKI